MKKFSDFAKEDLPFAGDKVRINDILNKEIIIVKYHVRPSKYKDKVSEYAIVQFKETEEGETKVFFTGSQVIIDMLRRYEEELPFATTILKIDRYYTLS